MTQPARFPDRSGEARRVEDKTKLCARWKRYGACSLDRHFNLTDDEKDPWNYPVYSKDMFDLMQKSCPDTCGWVESGCHDEHPRCEEWARLGLCNVNTNPSFMAHTCRESCGVCGFLSPHNLVSSHTSASLTGLTCQFRKLRGRTGGPTLTSDRRISSAAGSNLLPRSTRRLRSRRLRTRTSTAGQQLLATGE